MAAAKKNDKKDKPQKKPGRKLSPAQKLKNIDQDVIDKIVNDKKGELVLEAEKIAKEMVAKIDLQIDSDQLSDVQKMAAKLFAQGASVEKILDVTGLTLVQFEGWLKNPAFFKSINEYLFNDTIVNKNERVRQDAYMLDKIAKAIHKKLENNDLDDMQLSSLFKLYQDQSRLLAEKVDKVEEKDGPRDISIMIVNHYKSQGKEYNKLEDFLSDPSFDYRGVIDVESEEV